ncbi:MFS transporter [Actinosynnema pretiosum]|uniref:Major facilitator superfamily (MFS) profile domain-containing protein n=1 Tax=Actinosynnema pretiosum TaxID=42197 RepID=A0A290Z860_9PSEU|nr:MFS transporter [Actinosynnema pretiosum]ATE55198.1 hypothetical protein CNX65_19500 [Actinosynnema pretiosum]
MLTAPTIALPPVGGLLIRRVGVQTVLVVSVLLCAAGTAGLVLLGPGSTLATLALPLLAIGTGIGLPSGHLDRLAVGEAGEYRRGAAAALFNTVRLNSENIGIAAVGAAVAVLSPAGLAGEEFTTALRSIALVLAAIALATAVLLVVVNRRSSPPVEHGAEPVRAPDAAGSAGSAG